MKGGNIVKHEIFNLEFRTVLKNNQPFKSFRSHKYWNKNLRTRLLTGLTVLLLMFICSSCAIDNGKNLSNPPPSDDPGQFGSGRFLANISCTMPVMCVVGDDAGGIIIYKNGQWSSPVSVKNLNDDIIFSISCHTPALCVGVGINMSGKQPGQGHAFEILNGRLTPFALITSNYPLQSVSCITSSYCEAIGDGKVFAYDHGSWKTLRFIRSFVTGDPFDFISCPSQNFCGALSQLQYAAMENNGNWAVGTIPTNSHHFIESISCPVPGYCMALRGNGMIYIFSNGTWKQTGFALKTTTAISLSCWSIGNCEAITISGYGVAYRSGVWQKPILVAKKNGLYKISCVSKGTCMATDSMGYVFQLSRGRWSKPQLIEKFS